MFKITVYVGEKVVSENAVETKESALVGAGVMMQYEIHEGAEEVGAYITEEENGTIIYQAIMNDDGKYLVDEI